MEKGVVLRMTITAYDRAQLSFAALLVVATLGLVITGVLAIIENKKVTAAYKDQTKKLVSLTAGIEAATAYFRTERQRTLRSQQRQVINEVRNNWNVYKSGTKHGMRPQ